MKHFNSVVAALTATCAFAVSSYAADNILVNDTWADGDRTSTGPDGGGIDSQWFGSGGSLSVPAPGDLRGTVPAGSAFWTTYFTPAGSPVTLADQEQLLITWVFTPTTVNLNNTSQAFNLAVANTPSGSRAISDASPAAGIYSGYSMFMNMGQTLGNASPFALREWTLAGSGNLLGTAGNWGANGVASANLANGATSGNHGYDSGTQYTYTMSITRNGTDLNIVSTMTGGTVNGTGTMTDSITDTSANTFAFDTFAIRPSGSASAAGLFDTSLFRVDYFTVPEPATLTLAGLGVLGLVLAYRRPQR